MDKWHTISEKLPELGKVVEVLIDDGTIRRDILAKGKYGNYTWCRYVDSFVVGWHPIELVVNNKKENKTMTKTRENRMEALKAANIETGKYFSVTLPEGLKPGSTINVTISEDGTPVVMNPVDTKAKELTPDEVAFVNEIFNDGYVRNTRLHRRWVMAQMFRMLDYRSITGKSGYDAYLNERYRYQYQFDMMFEEIRVLDKLYDRDQAAFYERSLFFTPEVVLSTCEDYMQKLREYIDGLKVHKCKGVPYKKIFGQNIFLDDIERKIFEPQRKNLWEVQDATKTTMLYGYKNLCWALRRFCSQMYKLPAETPKCKEWKDAFKGEGSYYTLMNLIKFHGCRVRIDKCGSVKWLSLGKSIEYVIDAAKQYKGEYYRLFALMKKVIKDNEFDFETRMNEIYAAK